MLTIEKDFVSLRNDIILFERCITFFNVPVIIHRLVETYHACRHSGREKEKKRVRIFITI